MTEPTRKRPRLWVAAMVLIAVYIIGIFTGIGGCLLIVRQQMRKTFERPVTARGPIDFVLEKTERDLTRQARLSPAERAKIHQHLEAVSHDFKETRLHFAQRVRASFDREVEQMLAEIEPAKRAPARAVIEQRMKNWGLDRVPPETASTPTPVPQKAL